MSLVQRCPYFRVSFKRGSTVVVIVDEKEARIGNISRDAHSPVL